jgi:hypothetical protein
MLKSLNHQLFPGTSKSENTDVIMLYLILELKKGRGTTRFNPRIAYAASCSA